jgi:hypothetical protein
MVVSDFVYFMMGNVSTLGGGQADLTRDGWRQYGTVCQRSSGRLA